MLIAEHPLHGSGRAGLPHPALALGRKRETLSRVRLTDARIPPKNPAFLVPVHALSVIFCAKVCAGLKRAGLLDQVPPSVWTTPWVVHAQHAGRGQQVLDYLGRYVFRVALSNSRLEEIADGHVTFRYRDNRTQAVRHVTLTGGEFLGRFSSTCSRADVPRCATTDSGAPRVERTSRTRKISCAPPSSRPPCRWRPSQGRQHSPPIARGVPIVVRAR